MNKKRIFIDGREGTTGLDIFRRLEERDDISLIVLPQGQHRDVQARRRAINDSDVTVLCLPDDAARQAVSLVENSSTVVIDASTAHRTADGWVYGFPELSESQPGLIASSKRIAVPGCHASGFIALVYPLVRRGVLDKGALLTCHSITGYSGGGKRMIAEYQAEGRSEKYDAPRAYGLSQSHKHLPEMTHVTGLENAPVFSPIVCDFYSGMLVTVPMFAAQLCPGKTVDDVKGALMEQYSGCARVKYESLDSGGFADSNTLSGTDDMQLCVSGNEQRFTLMARYDNLGKGACGAALQCLDLVLGGVG